MSIMASSDCANDNKLKKVDKKSKKAIKKSKLKGNQEQINPMAIEKDMAKQKKKNFKKKGKKKSSVKTSEKGADDQNKPVTEKASDKLLEIKLSNKDYSINWNTFQTILIFVKYMFLFQIWFGECNIDYLRVKISVVCVGNFNL